MKKSLIVLMLFAFSGAFAQKNNLPRRDIKMGGGFGLLGTGDAIIGFGEIDLGKTWNRYFSRSACLNIGYGGPNFAGTFEQERNFTASANYNVMFSPFTNRYWYNLKLGAGLSYMYVANEVSYGDMFGASHTNVERRNAPGYNLIVENEFRIRKSLISLKVMIQPYRNEDITNSVMLKYGRILN